MSKRRKQDTLIFKIALLSISMFCTMAPAISPALPLMYNAFPGVSKAEVETLTTIPNIGIVIGLLFSPFLIKLIGQKMTVLVGLIVTLVAGTFPMYVNQYLPILISRFIIGGGIGLFNSLAVSLIPQFYSNDEEELATMIGYQGVMGGIGNAVVSFLLTWLLMINWHAAFSIYLLIIPSLILFAIFVSMPKEQKNNKKSNKLKVKQHLNREVALISILMFLLLIFYMPVSFKMPALVVQEKLGIISQLSTLSGILSIVGIPIGASFGFLFKKLHDKIFPIGFAIVTVGFLLIALASNFEILAVGNFVAGVGSGMGLPYMYNWLDWAAPKDSVNLATTIVLVLVNVGCFISPTIINAITSSPRGTFLVSAGFFGLFTIYAIFHYARVHNKLNMEKK